MPMSVISRETSEDIIEAMVAARNRIVPSQSSLKTTYSNSGRSNWRRLTDSLTFLSRLRRAKQYRLKENMIKRRWALITTVVRIAMRISADSSLERPRDPSVGGDSDCCCPSDIDTNDSLFSIRNSGVNRVGAGNDSGHCGRTNAYQEYNIASRKFSQNTVTSVASHCHNGSKKLEVKLHQKNRVAPEHFVIGLQPNLFNDVETVSSSSTKVSLRSLFCSSLFLKLLILLLFCCAIVAVLCAVL